MATQDTRQRVLIIDDTPENIEVLRQLLRGDYVVQAAINGKKGLEIAQAQPQPAAYLLDIMMPEMDGYEVCRRLKGLPATEHIPVVFITALDQTGHETTGLELGAVDFIRKPFEPLVVKARVHNHLRLKRYQQALEALVAGAHRGAGPDPAGHHRSPRLAGRVPRQRNRRSHQAHAALHAGAGHPPRRSTAPTARSSTPRPSSC